jgi:hypothetical protein
MARAIDWAAYDQMKAQGLSDRAIARRLGIPWGSWMWYKKRRGGQSPAPPTTPATPAIPVVEILSMINELRERVASLEQRRVVPTPPTPPVGPVPPAAERKDIQQWTIRLSKSLIDYLKDLAYERRIPPSQLIEEWLREKVQEKSS